MSEMKTLTVNGKSYTLSDEVARQQIAQLAAAVAVQAPAIVCKASGTAFTLEDSANRPLQGLRIFGRTVQEENPSPDAPKPLESVSGSITLSAADQPDQTLAADDLPGIPVETGGSYTDPAGQQWVCDELDYGRGVYIQRIGRLTLDGTETNLGYADAYNYLYIANVPNLKTDNTQCMCICTHFVGRPYKYVTTEIPTINADDGVKYFNIRGAGMTSIDAFRSFFAQQAAGGTPVQILYILETPVETPLDAQALAAFAGLRSRQPVTQVVSDGAAEIAYVADTKAYIDRRLGL